MSATAAATDAHFEALYAASDDPWQVRASWYEKRKRALLLACLDRPRYRNGFEPGCGNGEMSAALAERCDRLLACDGAASAVAAARRRLGLQTALQTALQPALQAAPQAAQRDATPAAGAGGERLRIEQRSLPAEWPRCSPASPDSPDAPGASGGPGAPGAPDPRFDLIVISELGYYFDAAGLAALAAAVQSTLAEDGLLVLCHWRHDFADRASSTAQVHTAFGRAGRMARQLRHLERDFLLETWRPRGSLASAAVAA